MSMTQEAPEARAARIAARWAKDAQEEAARLAPADKTRLDTMAEEIATGYARPSTFADGSPMAGDIFYSDLFARIKRIWPHSRQNITRSHAHGYLCAVLQSRGFWVHS